MPSLPQHRTKFRYTNFLKLFFSHSVEIRKSNSKGVVNMAIFDDSDHGVNFCEPRPFGTKLKSTIKEALFPDDPFRQFRKETKAVGRFIRGIQYFVPIFEWLPSYNLRLFASDFLAGLTITSLAIPQGISYAKLASIPPIIGLCKHVFTFSISYFL